MYNITARGIFMLHEGKNIPYDRIYATDNQMSVVSKLARSIKLKILELTSSTGEIDCILELQPIYAECGELLPEVLQQLWIDGFDVSFDLQLRNCYRPFLFFRIPAKCRVWLLTITAASKMVRNKRDYMPISIPPCIMNERAW